MKKFTYAILALALILTLGVVSQTQAEMRCYVINNAGQSGEAMRRSPSGVSLCGTIDMQVVKAQSTTAGFHVPTVYFTDSATWTGITGDAGVTVQYRYAQSPVALTTAEWEAMGVSGTTSIAVRAIGSSTTPYYVHAVTLPVSRYLGIFQGNLDASASTSAYQVSEPYICFQ